MIDLQYIRQFFPTGVANNPQFDKQMLKEYLQLMILEHRGISQAIRAEDRNT